MTKEANSNRDTEEEGLHKVDTVPPPAGEDDAYSAPTRLHEAPPEAILSAMKEATRLGRPLKPQALPKIPSEKPPALMPVALDEDTPDASTPSTSTFPTSPPPSTDVPATGASDAAGAAGPAWITSVVKKTGRVDLPLSVVVGIACGFIILLMVITMLLFGAD